MDEKEYSNIYTIPPNYTDSGKLFGGMLETRNTVETGLLLLLIGYPELIWLSMPAAAKAVVMTVTLLPLCVAGLMGVGGDSLMQYLARAAVFLTHRRRKLHFKRIGYRYEKEKRQKAGIHSKFHARQGNPKRHHRNHGREAHKDSGD
jgi:hypothetical protein